MPIPAPIFLGYRLKGLPVNGVPKLPAHVVEICSVSDCIRGRPEGARESWDGLNAAGCYDTPALALATLREGEFTSCELFAFALSPIRLTSEARPRVYDLQGLLGCDPATLPPRPPLGLVSLRFDAVSVFPFRPATAACSPCMAFFGHSPLSCNGLANELDVNQYCLFPDHQAAMNGASRFTRERPEPGAYVVVEVMRCER